MAAHQLLQVGREAEELYAQAAVHIDLELVVDDQCILDSVQAAPFDPGDLNLLNHFHGFHL